jgi:hypothetical protein
MNRIASLDSSNDLDGFADLGMKREALRLARQNLHNPEMGADAFNRAVGVVLTHADRLKGWAKVIEQAYARIPGHEQLLAHSWIFAYFYTIKDYTRAARFITRGRKAAWEPHHLALAWDMMHELGNRHESLSTLPQAPGKEGEGGTNSARNSYLSRRPYSNSR